MTGRTAKLTVAESGHGVAMAMMQGLKPTIDSIATSSP
jgi:hypothetical protein